MDRPSDSDARYEEYNFNIDYKKLGEEMLKKIELDELYWKQNDAKIRAVSQTKCYEDFRQVVLAAHLSPLKPEEKDKLIHQSQARDRVVWNNVK